MDESRGWSLLLHAFFWVHSYIFFSRYSQTYIQYFFSYCRSVLFQSIWFRWPVSRRCLIPDGRCLRLTVAAFLLEREETAVTLGQFFCLKPSKRSSCLRSFVCMIQRYVHDFVMATDWRHRNLPFHHSAWTSPCISVRLDRVAIFRAGQYVFLRGSY